MHFICIQLLMIFLASFFPLSIQAEEDMLARGFRGRPMPIEGGEHFQPPRETPEQFQRAPLNDRPLDPQQRQLRREELLDEPYLAPGYVLPIDDVDDDLDDSQDSDSNGQNSNSNGQDSDFDNYPDPDFDKP